MKKSLVIIAAAAILASCSNESVLREIRNTEQPSVISFSSYSEKSTKADNGDNTNINNLEYFHSTFAVFATKMDQDSMIQYVFGDTATKLGTTCTYTGNDNASFHNSNWRYVDERFWDKWSNYNFIACAPAPVDTSINTLHFTYGDTIEVGAIGTRGRDFLAPHYYLTGKNLQSTPTATLINKGFNVEGEDLDLMTSGLVTRPGSTQDQVQLSFKHILSKLNISIGKTAILNSSTVTIDSIVITGLSDKGSYKESMYDISTDADVSGWTVLKPNNNPNYSLYYKVTEQVHPALTNADTNPAKVNPLYFIESLVIPQTIADTAKITLNYNIVTGAHKEYYKYEKALKEIFTSFFDRKSYTIVFTIDPGIITFDAGVATWDNQDYPMLP